MWALGGIKSRVAKTSQDHNICVDTIMPVHVQKVIDLASESMVKMVHDIICNPMRPSEQFRSLLWLQVTDLLRAQLKIIRLLQSEAEHIPLFSVACDIEISTCEGNRWPDYKAIVAEDVRRQPDHPWLRIFDPVRRDSEIAKLGYDFREAIQLKPGENDDNDRGRSHLCSNPEVVGSQGRNIFEDLVMAGPSQPEQSSLGYLEMSTVEGKCERCKASQMECKRRPGHSCEQCRKKKKKCSVAMKRKRSDSAVLGSGDPQVLPPGAADQPANSGSKTYGTRSQSRSSPRPSKRSPSPTPLEASPQSKKQCQPCAIKENVAPPPGQLAELSSASGKGKGILKAGAMRLGSDKARCEDRGQVASSETANPAGHSGEVSFTNKEHQQMSERLSVIERNIANFQHFMGTWCRIAHPSPFKNLDDLQPFQEGSMQVELPWNSSGHPALRRNDP
ncbi:hypothetical protein JVT61DRAFT_3499 [Boletus reticuloceps]|uniref:Uncharacterized protein n=1 Tax=Boletus reticuloceps TaxID=495285 RepID=A0A8I3A804_9AGAM|nr:hypothetical protein JVT61DRAFT_3499 [Boletus reticuloceps]